MTDVTFKIDGIIEASVHHESYPNPMPVGLMNFINCTNLTISGTGVVDGLGYDWWIREWSKKNKNGRPKLLSFNKV
jgi:hypothetical protein